MKKADSVSKAKNLNRGLLWGTFIRYIETMYFNGAIDVLDERLISFEFENFKSYYLN